jgi:Mrp family chromosome partitioning ATPase
MVIVDSGPVTASVEAIPVAASCDGAMLVLRRGRSRSVVPESIAEIRSAGADYLGLVLNVADQADCIRYGSMSRAIDADDPAARAEDRTPVHPLLAVGRVLPGGAAEARRDAA